VLPGRWAAQQLPSIKTWVHGAPIWALEIASTDGRKDYLRAPQVYERVGVQELVVYDPNWRQRKDGARWQVWRQTSRGWDQVESNCAKQVYCEQLEAWLVEVMVEGEPRVRPGVGPQGRELLKLDSEEAHEARLREQQAIERQEKERQARELAEQREKALELELQRLRTLLDEKP
jgi:hypothetical protein